MPKPNPNSPNPKLEMGAWALYGDLPLNPPLIANHLQHHLLRAEEYQTAPLHTL